MSCVAGQCGSVERPLQEGLGSSAFTLLELLISVAVVTVLLAISLPALRGARTAAERTTTLAVQPQLLSSIRMYSTDFRDSFPYLGVPGKPGETFVHRGWTDRFGLLYFHQNKSLWLTLVLFYSIDSCPGSAFDRDSVFPFFVSRNGDAESRNPMVYSPFFLAHATAATPAFWRDPLEPASEHQLKGTAWGDVRFTSRKGLILDARLSSGPQVRASVGMADGSADWLDLSSETDRDRVVDRTALGAMPWPVMSTRDGLAGWDR